MNQLKSALATLRPSDVLTKTPRGEAEFSQRVRSLPQKVRGVLILVNGRRTVAEIESLLPILPVFGTLAALVATGYVHELPAESPVSAVPLPVQGEPRTVAAPHGAANDTIVATVEHSPLEDLRQAAVAQLHGLAGEAAANLIGRIQTSRRLGELRIELQRASQVLERFVGTEVAQIFLEEMTARVHQVSEARDDRQAVAG